MAAPLRPAATKAYLREKWIFVPAISGAFIGESQLTLGELRYAFNPQGAALSDGKKAFEKFPEGTTGFLVCRLGIDRDTDIAADQFVTVYPVEFGPQQETTEGDAEAAEVAITQSVAITGPKRMNTAVLT